MNDATRNAFAGNGWGVFLAAFVVFATSVTVLEGRPTDVSALRLMDGDVPYRDFWTMYAPGSFVTLAMALTVFGRELVVSNLLGIITSAFAVALLFRLVRSVASSGVAWALAGLVTAGFYGTGYHTGFTSYPAALALILIAVTLASSRCREAGWRWAVAPGLLLGAAALYKHDVAGYAALSAGGAVLVVRLVKQSLPRWSPVLALGAAAAAVPLAAAAVLTALGAGADLWNDLIRFPLGDFRQVRGQSFPIIPQLRGSLTDSVQALRLWAMCNLPTVAAAAGVIGLRRTWRLLNPGALYLATFSLIAFCFHWSAAHVQLNTHAISLAAWGTLLGAVGFSVPVRRARSLPARRASPWMITGLVTAVLLAWSALFVAPEAYAYATASSGTDWVGLPGLRGVRAEPEDAVRLRSLADAIAAAAPPEAPLLFVSERNDVVVFASPIPFWLSPRRVATRIHEPHPGISDTGDVQRRMLADIAGDVMPVVVREHRFDDATLDRVLTGSSLQRGAMLLDEWISEFYEPGVRFGRYEVMRRREDQ